MPSVLIVDDDLKLLKMLHRTVIYENLEVFTAANGLEALPLVQTHNPDLIILDWMMPKMDGMTLVHKLREAENQTLILMLTPVKSILSEAAEDTRFMAPCIEAVKPFLEMLPEKRPDFPDVI